MCTAPGRAGPSVTLVKSGQAEGRTVSLTAHACSSLARTPSLPGQPLASFLSLLRSHLTGAAALTSGEEQLHPCSLFLSLLPVFFDTLGTSLAPPWLGVPVRTSEPVWTQSPHLLNGRKNNTYPPLPFYSVFRLQVMTHEVCCDIEPDSRRGKAEGIK